MLPDEFGATPGRLLAIARRKNAGYTATARSKHFGRLAHNITLSNAEVMGGEDRTLERGAG